MFIFFGKISVTVLKMECSLNQDVNKISTTYVFLFLKYNTILKYIKTLGYIIIFFFVYKPIYHVILVITKKARLKN